MKGKTAEALWQDYHFLTKEMKKFLTQQDMELFNDLMNQREMLQTIIDETADNGFKVSGKGKNLLTEIQQVNQEITNNMQLLHSSSKRHHQVSEAYGAASTTAVCQMDWKR
jgi:uncharacterized protein YoxC